MWKRERETPNTAQTSTIRTNTVNEERFSDWSIDKACNCWETLLATQGSGKDLMIYWKNLKYLGEGSRRTRQSSRWMSSSIGKNNSKGFECCNNILRVARFRKVSSSKLNVFKKRSDPKLMEYYLWNNGGKQ